MGLFGAEVFCHFLLSSSSSLVAPFGWYTSNSPRILFPSLQSMVSDLVDVVVVVLASKSEPSKN